MLRQALKKQFFYIHKISMLQYVRQRAKNHQTASIGCMLKPIAAALRFKYATVLFRI
jgi:hypothetical protein